MAGNLMYFPYTAIILIIVIGSSLIVRKQRGSGATKKFFMVAIPIFILIQLYFWNLDFNKYMKSYLFPSTTYECEYKEELKNLSISLPKRTVLIGRQDVCSSIYSTYVNNGCFKDFYNNELSKLKNKGEIESYRYFKETEDDKNGFLVELTSGSIIEIGMYRHKVTNEWTILIDDNLPN